MFVVVNCFFLTLSIQRFKALLGKPIRTSFAQVIGAIAIFAIITRLFFILVFHHRRIGRRSSAQKLEGRSRHKKGIAAIGPCALTLARAEGLGAHANAVALRLGVRP